jgi:hypothetical protein
MHWFHDQRLLRTARLSAKSPDAMKRAVNGQPFKPGFHPTKLAAMAIDLHHTGLVHLHVFA